MRGFQNDGISKKGKKKGIEEGTSKLSDLNKMKLACPSSSCLKVAVLSLARRKLRNKQIQTLLSQPFKGFIANIVNLKKGSVAKTSSKVSGERNFIYMKSRDGIGLDWDIII